MAVEARQAAEISTAAEISKELVNLRTAVEQLRDELREMREILEQIPRGQGWASSN